MSKATAKMEYLVQVDQFKRWTPGVYRAVTTEELDELLDVYGRRILTICASGAKGAMAMWACFKSRISGGCYSDMINAYRLMMPDDPKSLVDREHELRHAWNEYEELWRIRHFGTVEAYYRKKAEEARERFERYNKPKEDNQNV